MRNRRRLGIAPKLPSGSFAQRCVQSPFDPVRRLTRGAPTLHWARIFWMVPCSPGVHFGKASSGRGRLLKGGDIDILHDGHAGIAKLLEILVLLLKRQPGHLVTRLPTFLEK